MKKSIFYFGSGEKNVGDLRLFALKKSISFFLGFLLLIL